MELAPCSSMRRIVLEFDQLPGWAFVLVATVMIGAIRVAGSLAVLAGNASGVELTRLLSYIAVLLLLIFAIRRRQTSAFEGAGQVLIVLAVSSLLGLAALWPLLPRSLPVPLLRVLEADAGDQVAFIVFGLPVATLILWLSRRWGSDSTVTERRLRLVMQVLRARAERRTAPRETPIPGEKSDGDGTVS